MAHAPFRRALALMAPLQHMALFPTPLPDETLFSVYCRYHALSGNSQAADTRLQLTGHSAEGFRRRPMTTLLELHARLPREIFPDYEGLLLHYTLYPYYLTIARFPVIPSRLAADCDEWLAVFPEIRGQGGGTWTSRRKFCARCVVDDLSTYGVAYWHRIHQPDECVVCRKHRCRLIWSCPYCGDSYRVDHELYLPSLICSVGHAVDPDSPMFTESILEPELVTARWCEELLSAYKSAGHHGVLLSLYRDRMQEKGWDRDIVDGLMTHRSRHYAMVQIRKFWGLDRHRRLPVAQNRLYPAGNAPCLRDSITAHDIFFDVDYFRYHYNRKNVWLTNLWVIGYLLGSVRILDRAALLARAANQVDLQTSAKHIESSLTTRYGEREPAYSGRDAPIEAQA